jgi:SAM-dependent methyltransferase
MLNALPCRVCGADVSCIFHSDAPSIMGITHPVDEPLSVYLCENCGHGQSDNIDFDQYYSKEYRFELQSAEHDQLTAVVDGVKIYRADVQVQAVLTLLDIPRHARILDYGAAKASTLKKLCAQRPDVIPSVFDVSEEYAVLWDEWIPKDRQAFYKVPQDWSGQFDAVLCFFALEHVEKPNDIYADLARLLAPGGKILFVVPNPLANVGDFVVLEHVNHYTQSSIARLAENASLRIVDYSDQLFPGAHVVVASREGEQVTRVSTSAEEIDRMKAAALFMRELQMRVIEKAKDGKPAVIYGAGVYGNYIATRVERYGVVKAFVDRNPQLWGMSDFGIPVVGPENLPEGVGIVYAGVNPLRARDWLSNIPEWAEKSIEIVYLD